MPTTLQLDEAITENIQQVKDGNGTASALFLTSTRVAVGTTEGSPSVVSICLVPADRRAHLQLGDPVAKAFSTSAKLSFSGSTIEHAGFAWVPGDSQLTNGKLHLTFGGSDDPTPRSKQPARVTFQANGNVGIGTTDPTELLEVNGNILASGDVKLAGADCAEDFDIDESAPLEAGSVVVIGDHERLQQCNEPYDRRVAGVLSGAGTCRPGIVLDNQPSRKGRRPVALSGKVYCKVDATYASVQVGDLMTTSPTPGHAMKAVDSARAFGAVLGKALRPLISGTGLVPILVSLQ